jgi:two-component system chemotaxis sensor kinase CheA
MEKVANLQEQLFKRDKYLEGIVQMQSVLLETPSDALGALNGALRPLGEASGADRVYVFENDRIDGKWLGTTSQKAEWCASGIPPQIDSPQLQNADFSFMPVWLETLKAGRTVIRLKKDFDDNEKEILGPQGILSLIVIPLMIDDVWTGFIGFDNCHEEAPWTDQELSLLKWAASQISLNFQQRRARRDLLEPNLTLEQKVLERTAQLAAANRLIQGMVDSVSQGFFMFDSKGICESVYSRACAELLEGVPAGRPVVEVLNQSGPEADQFNSWFPMLFKETPGFDVVSGLGPRVFRPRKSNRYIELEYFSVPDDSGNVSRVVVIATDRTAERDANLRAEERKNYADMILKLVRHRRQFAGFVAEGRSYLTLMLEEFAKSAPNLAAIFRSIHTFKGAAASFSMTEVARIAHEYETELSSLRGQVESGRPPDFSGWPARIRLLSEKLEAFLGEHKGILGGAAGKDGAPVEIPQKALRSFVEQLQGAAPSCSKLVSDFGRNYLSETAESLFGHYREVVDLLAKRQSKEVKTLEIEGAELRILAEPYGELFGSLVHAFRNAVDHGLETPEERSAQGKPLAGAIVLRVSREKRDSGHWLKLQVRDDGRGMDPAKIRAKLASKGHKEVERESDEEVIQPVFDSGFSTREEVTDLSGRGIGMDAIRSAALRLGGACRVVSQPGKGSTLVVEFPEREPVI